MGPTFLSLNLWKLTMFQKSNKHALVINEMLYLECQEIGPKVINEVLYLEYQEINMH